MERREALRNMAITVWGLMLLPGCDIGKNKSIAESGPLSLSSLQNEALTQAVDTLIPATDTPGAADLNVDGFIQKIMAHCYEMEDQKAFVNGLTSVQEYSQENYGKTLGSCTKKERVQLLADFEQSDNEEKNKFFATLKELTILGYTTSEYVLTNLTDYNMTPGHYYGCVPVNSKKPS